MTGYSSSNGVPPQRLVQARVRFTERMKPVPDTPPDQRTSPTDAPIQPGSDRSVPSEDVLDGVLRPVHAHLVRTERISWFIFDFFALAPPTIAAPIILLNVSMHPLGATGIAAGVALLWAVFLFLTWKQPRWRYQSLRYAVSENGIEIHHGIFWRHVVNVPRSRIQHTDVEQGPIMRKYGLATLQVHTAGVEHNKVDLPGLTHSVAMTLRDDLAKNRAVHEL